MKTSHIMCILKILAGLCLVKQGIKTKKNFCKCCLQCFGSEKFLIKHKENCLIINSKQNVKLGKSSVSFKNHSKQLSAPFNIYADFECILSATPSKGVKSSDKNNGSYTQKYKDHIPCSFAYKVVCVDNKFSKDVVLYRGKNATYKFIEAILEYKYCKKVIKNILTKILLCLQKKKKSFN